MATDSKRNNPYVNRNNPYVNRNNPYVNFISSAIGTGVAEIATLPACTVKTVYQNDLSFNSSLSAAKGIYKTRGIRGFYRASYSAISSQMLTSSLKYTSYQTLKKYNDSNTFTANALNSMAGNIATSLVTHPIDVIKINQQLDTFSFRGYLAGGAPQWYKGYSKTIAKNMTGAVTFMPLYDSFNSYFNSPLLASFCASVTAAVIMHPIDLFKTRHIGNQKNIYVKNIFRGIGLNLMRIVPHFTISITLIEKIKETIVS